MNFYNAESLSPHQKLVTFTFVNSGESVSYNLYMNHSQDVPGNTFIWDYYGSGEAYYDFTRYNVISAKSNIKSLYTQYFSSCALPDPAKAGLTPTHFATSIVFNGRFVWAFSLDLFFQYETIVKEMPICSYISFSNSQNSVKSSHYSFANLPENTPCCSHPTMPQGKISYCHYLNSNFNCPIYISSSKVTLTKSVQPKNTSSKFKLDFSINYYISDSFNHVFELVNNTNSSVLNTLKYTSDHTYDEVYSEVLSIFNEYLSSYEESEYSLIHTQINDVNDSSKDQPRRSYIESLIGI